MPTSEPRDQQNENDVLTNLPRSRRQRPSVRRDAARAAQASAKTHSALTGTAEPVFPEAAAIKQAKQPTPPAAASGVPRAGYATPNAGHSFGDADPAGLLTELTRAALRLLPG